MHSALHLMLIDICIMFREYSFSGFQVIEQTRFVTDRQTDARGKTICLPTLKGETYLHVYDETPNLVNFVLLSLTELYLQQIMQVSC